MRGLLLSLSLVLPALPAWAEPVLWDEAEGGDGRYYEYVTEALTWTDAREAAAARRHRGVPGRLVVITSATQNAFVHGLIGGEDQRAWIGLTDEAEEGDFRWVDGTRPGYTNWSPGEPNNADDNEHYGEMLPNGRWNDKMNDPPAQRVPPQGYLVEYYAPHRLAATQAGARDVPAG